jgi:ribose transport system substrate-binding protein
MGDFLVQTLGGKGNIWVLRGLAGHPEDKNRYNGLVQALKGSDIKITAEEYGDWQYDKAKKICETASIASMSPTLPARASLRHS